MTKKPWHREDIKAAVRKTGLTLEGLSLKHGLAPHACSVALCGRHPPAEAAIAEHINVPLWDLWPARWRRPHRDGDPAIRIDHRRRKKSRTGGPGRHRQNDTGNLT